MGEFDYIIVGAGSAVVWTAFSPQIKQVLGLNGPNDYSGSGNGETATEAFGAPVSLAAAEGA